MTVKVSNFEKDGNILSFDISGVEVKIVNAFRRTIISQVPTIAIEQVTFLYNSSILNDENLAHRLGMVPLTTDLKTYVPMSECKCEGKGCGRCVCLLTMDVTGPRTLYSGDLISKDESVKPVFDKIPLVKLGPEQHVKIEAEARLGTGREHIKWQGGTAAYEVKDKDTYHVMVESYGPLQVEELVKTAFDVVEAKIKQVKDKVH
ncbi:MAG: DNA-directed RNA polymerase subunit D [Candidatus Altiarchaeota archaeon]